MTFFQCFPSAHHSPRFLFFADRSEIRHGLLLLQPICPKVWHVDPSETLFCSAQLYTVITEVTVAFPSAQSMAGCSPLTSLIPIHRTATHYNWCFLCVLFSPPFCINSRDCCLWKSQKINSFNVSLFLTWLSANSHHAGWLLQWLKFECDDI